MQIEPNTFICADNMEVLRDIPDGFCDLCLTDPPYGLDFPYLSFQDTFENMKKLIELTVPEIRRISKIAAISVPIIHLMVYPQPDWICASTWNTTGQYGKMGVNQWYPIFIYGKDLPGFGSINGMIKGDVFIENGGGSVGFMRSGDENHPCPKPLGPWTKIVRRFSMLGDIVIDPFCGSGTTALACHKTGRRFICIDREPKYIEIAQQRYNDLIAQQDLFGAQDFKESEATDEQQIEMRFE
jgi:DNA modification methylase